MSHCHQYTMPQLPPLDFSSKPSSPTKNRLAAITADESPLQRKLSMKRSMSSASTNSDHALRSRKSKTASLFQLFSRPNVEKARGYNEHEPLPPLPQMSTLPEPSRRDSVAETLRGNQSSNRRPATPTQTPEAPKILKTPSPHKHNVHFDLPPLFQAYSQAVKYASLEAVDQSVSTPLEGRAQQLRQMASIDGIRGRQSTDSASVTGTWSKRGSIVRSQTSYQEPNRGIRKVYVLVNAGYLLEYAGDGAFDRMPEVTLKLGKDSAAFASDLVPGKPHVLQIVQAPTSDPVMPTLRSQKSFFSRKKSDISRPASSLLLVCEGADHLDEWLAAIRKEIEVLGGKRYHAPADVRVSTDEDGFKVSPSHRSPVLTRKASEASSRSSKMSNMTAPTMSESRTSTHTFVGSGSDRSDQRITSRKFSDPPRLSFYTTSHDYLDLMPEVPSFDISTPTDSFATLSVSSSPTVLDSERNLGVPHHDNVRVSSAWDASLCQDHYTVSDNIDTVETAQFPDNWPLPQQYFTPTKAQPLTESQPTFDFLNYHTASTTLPKAMIPLRDSSSPLSAANLNLQKTRNTKTSTPRTTLIPPITTTTNRSPSTGTSTGSGSGSGARLSLYPLPLRVSLTPTALATAQANRLSRSRSPPTSRTTSSYSSTSPTLPSYNFPGSPNPNSALRRPSSIVVRADPTPFLSQNRPKAPRAASGVARVDASGNARSKGRKNVPLLLSLPPPTAPPTGPLPMLPASAGKV